MPGGLIFRDDGAWGSGKGSNLSASDFDNDIWILWLAIQEKAVQGVGIAEVFVTGNQLYFQFTDHTWQGPFTLPVAQLNGRGTWQPDTAYYINDMVTIDGGVYQVIFNHMSEGTFDPGANDGLGHDFYKLWFTWPSDVLPTGGLTGQSLVKASSANFDVEWSSDTFAGLFDVLFSSLVVGQVPRWNGTKWANSNPTVVLPVTTQSGATFTPAITDANSYVRMTAGTATVTMPSNASVAFPLFTEITFRQVGAGTLTFESEITSPSDVPILNFPVGYLNSSNIDGATVAFKKVATDEWDAMGLLAS